MATYKTTAEIKTRLGITGSGDDDFIDALRDTVYAEIALLIGYTFPGTTETRNFDWPRHGGMDLKTGYLHTITAVTNGDGESLTEGTHYIVRYDSVLRMLRSSGKRWTYQTDQEEAIAVSATFGLPTTHDLYNIVKGLEAGLVEWHYRARDTAIASEVSFTANSAIVLAPAKSWPLQLQRWLGMLKQVLI
jgi:hypothetical protein